MTVTSQTDRKYSMAFHTILCEFCMQHEKQLYGIDCVLVNFSMGDINYQNFALNGFKNFLFSSANQNASFHKIPDLGKINILN